MGVCAVSFIVAVLCMVVKAVPVVFKESTPNGESILSISSSDPNVEKYWTQQLATRSGFTQLKEKEEEKDLPYKSNAGVIRSSYTAPDDASTGGSFASASSGPGSIVSTGRGFASASSGSAPTVASSGRSFSSNSPGQAVVSTGRGFASASSNSGPVFASSGRGFASASSASAPVIASSGRGFAAASTGPIPAVVSSGRGFASGPGQAIVSTGKGFASASSSSGPAFVSTGRGFPSNGPFLPFFSYPFSTDDFGYNSFDLNDWMRNFESFYNPNFPGNGQVSASATAVNDNGHFYGKVDTVGLDNKAKSVTFDSNDKSKDSKVKNKH